MVRLRGGILRRDLVRGILICGLGDSKYVNFSTQRFQIEAMQVVSTRNFLSLTHCIQDKIQKMSVFSDNLPIHTTLFIKVF